jgi:hypothetical protein
VHRAQIARSPAFAVNRPDLPFGSTVRGSSPAASGRSGSIMLEIIGRSLGF